ncbi:MAG: hypothetical protein M3Y82_07195 [Verrucomicrobiota bacterium]|nr:hypothetical protein [Verrucomicrobiota bacterium]
MAKAEVGWKRQSPDGEKIECYAQHVGNRWKFFTREKRFEQWQSVENPPLEDWMELLESVRRRIGRRLLRPEEEGRIKKAIKERFPEIELARDEQ